MRGSSFYGRGSGDILMDEVNCRGSETNLAQCSFTDSRNHDCSHAEDVGIVCPTVGNELFMTVTSNS